MPFDRLADKYLQIKASATEDAVYGWHAIHPGKYVLGWLKPSGLMLYSEAIVELQSSGYWKCSICGSYVWSLHSTFAEASSAAKEHLGVNLP